MNAPTIAEIIGVTADGRWPHDGRHLPPTEVWSWTCQACGEVVDELDYKSKCSKDWRDAAPDVDTMLGWLVEHTTHGMVLVEARLRRGEPVGDAWAVGLDGLEVFDPFVGPTLHAALCDAARAVHASVFAPHSPAERLEPHPCSSGAPEAENATQRPDDGGST